MKFPKKMEHIDFQKSDPEIWSAIRKVFIAVNQKSQ